LAGCIDHPFGPLLLELQGFYDYPLRKTVFKSVKQSALALLWLAILVCGCAIFFRLNLSSRSVLLLFAIIGTVFLTIKERLIVVHLRSRTVRGDHREKVILAGSSEEICALQDRFPQDQNSEIEIVKTLDIAIEPISELVRSLHEHSEVRDFQTWVKLDLEYIDNWSIWLDLKILSRTIPAVLLGHGAK
jgi:FlaA1/EpsC-like NDP-sugar epimerase